MIPKAWFTKVNIDKLDFIKIKNFCSSRDTGNRMKSHKIGEILVNHMSNKELELWSIKELSKLNNKKINNPI